MGRWKRVWRRYLEWRNTAGRQRPRPVLVDKFDVADEDLNKQSRGLGKPSRG